MQIDMKNVTIKIKDGSATPNELEVTIGEGNLTWSEKRTIEYTLNRGLLDEVREGDQVPVDVSMDLVWDYVTGASGSPTVPDALRGINSASSWVSSDDDECRPYAVDIELVNAVTPATCGDSETIILADFRVEDLSYDLKAGTIAATGKCNITRANATRA